MKSELNVILGIVFVTIFVIASGYWLFGSTTKVATVRDTESLMGEQMPDLGGIHVAEGNEHPAYNSNPPTSGWHWEGLAGAGIKDTPVPDELLLHSMEHGAVVVWYRDNLEQNEIDTIKEAFNSASGKKILVPRKDLDVPVALTSWGYLLKLEEIDQSTIIDFIETNNNKAPEDEEI